MSYIEIKNLTKDYGNNKGLFNISFDVKKGETFGLVGINGAGKTTILRHLMGFIRQNEGTIKINDLDPYLDAKELKKQIAYIPGEINFPSLNSGDDFIKHQSKFWNKESDRAYEIASLLELDTRANLRRMSKGMKQKTAISVAFLPDNDILIFDEPSTGLDPLMRKLFIDIIESEKQKGKTIIMSSHMFDELETCCDRVAMLKEGKILRIVDIENEIKYNKNKKYKIEFNNEKGYLNFIYNNEVRETNEKYYQVVVIINDNQINEFMNELSKYDIKFIKEIKISLEDLFLEEYRKESKNV